MNAQSLPLAIGEAPDGLRLHLGSGRNHLEGFVNVDICPLPGVDVVCDLSCGLPLYTNSVGYAAGIHLFEHLREPIAFMNDLWRVCKQGAIVEFITPYWSSQVAYEDPTHVRFMTENSWAYFNRSLYPNTNADYGVESEFEMLECHLIPAPEFRDDPELSWKIKHWLNVIQAMHVKLKVVKWKVSAG